jgi:hypothetical protein
VLHAMDVPLHFVFFCFCNVRQLFVLMPDKGITCCRRHILSSSFAVVLLMSGHFLASNSGVNLVWW